MSTGLDNQLASREGRTGAAFVSTSDRALPVTGEKHE